MTLHHLKMLKLIFPLIYLITTSHFVYSGDLHSSNLLLINKSTEIDYKDINDEKTTCDLIVEIINNNENKVWKYKGVSNYTSNSLGKNLQESYYNLTNGLDFVFRFTEEGILFQNLEQLHEQLLKNYRKEIKRLKKIVGRKDAEYQTFKNLENALTVEFITSKLAEDINIYYTPIVAEAQESFGYDSFVNTPFGVAIPVTGEFLVKDNFVEWNQYVEPNSLQAYIESKEVEAILPPSFDKNNVKNYRISESAIFTKTMQQNISNVNYQRKTETIASIKLETFKFSLKE